MFFKKKKYYPNQEKYGIIIKYKSRKAKRKANKYLLEEVLERSKRKKVIFDENNWSNGNFWFWKE